MIDEWEHWQVQAYRMGVAAPERLPAAGTTRNESAYAPVASRAPAHKDTQNASHFRCRNAIAVFLVATMQLSLDIHCMPATHYGEMWYM